MCDLPLYVPLQIFFLQYPGIALPYSPLKKMLPEYSLPHEIRFRDELPVTNLGKVNFKELENEN
jgi:hypothetical protein